MHKDGFTLIEVVWVIVIVGIIAAMAAPFVSSVLDSWLMNKSERDLVFSARHTLNLMVREIRHASSITTTDPTEFAFTHIIDNTPIDYRQSGNSLLRNSDELTDKLQSCTPGPCGLNFTYLGSNMVRIKLILTVPVSSRLGSDTITIESLARFRNIP